MGDSVPEKVKTKIIEILYSWTVAFPNEAKISDAYQTLRRQGKRVFVSLLKYTLYALSTSHIGWYERPHSPTFSTGLITSDPELPADRMLIPSPPTRAKNPVFDNEDMGKVWPDVVFVAVWVWQLCGQGGMARTDSSLCLLTAAGRTSEEQKPRGPSGGQQTHQEHGEGGEETHHSHRLKLHDKLFIRQLVAIALCTWTLFSFYWNSYSLTYHKYLILSIACRLLQC